MKIENKKTKQNGLIKQKFVSNFALIKFALYFIKATKQYFNFFQYKCYILFCRKFHAEFKYGIIFSYWTLLGPHPVFCRGIYRGTKTFI
jgi:hypothetical protein